MSLTSPAAETLIDNRFLIEATVKSGSMGSVFRARDLHTDSLVALKVVQQAGTSIDEETRFSREAQALAALRHPRIVAYIAKGQTSAGNPYLAMEWLSGEDLKQRLSRQQLSVFECLRLAEGVAEGLSLAHRSGFLHRDIKPSNLFLRGREIEKVTLLDFGITRRLFTDDDMTRSGRIVGTPDYMAPEQARGQRSLDHRVDIYSLGCVLFECLTGHPPFQASHLSALIAKILYEAPPKLRSLRPELSEQLEELLSCMLNKDPRARPANVDMLLAQLRTIASREQNELPVATQADIPAQLGKDELRWVSLVLASQGGARIEAQPTLTDGELVPERLDRNSLSAGLSAFGARIEWLPDGALCAMLHRELSAIDLVASAVELAACVQRHWPAAIVAVATGRRVLQGGLAVGDLLDRAGHLLQGKRSWPRTQLGMPERESAILLDEVSAKLLGTRFSAAQNDPELTLVGNPGDAGDTGSLSDLETPFVGRERELGVLESAVSKCIDDGTACALLVIAQAGVGKSRLRLEFLRRFSARYPELLILTGRGDFRTAASPYGLLRQVLRQLRDLPEVASLAAQLPLPDDPGGCTSQPDPRLLGEELTASVIELFRHACKHRPLLLVLEDLHWGDTSSLALLDAGLRELHPLPFMVLAFARPELEERIPGLWMHRSRFVMNIKELSQRGCQCLVQALAPELQAKTAARIIEQSGGIPFLLKELVRAARKDPGSQPPETVLAMLQARILGLGAKVRRVLRAAAIFGDTFWEGGLKTVLGEERSSSMLELALEALINAELVERHRSSRFAGEAEYGFRQALLREAAYAMLTEADLQIGHRLAGMYLAAVGETDFPRLAEHFRRGADFERAALYAARAKVQSEKEV